MRANSNLAQITDAINTSRNERQKCVLLAEVVRRLCKKTARLRKESRRSATKRKRFCDTANPGENRAIPGVRSKAGDPPMMRKLSSWKEIAQYLGKGVRTVQRWELEFGLPVRRFKKEHGRGSVVAIADELDSWLETHTTKGRRALPSPLEFKKDALLEQLAFLEAENGRLQQELRELRAESYAIRRSGLSIPSDYGSPTDYARLLSSSAALRQQTTEVIEIARTLQLLRSQKG